MRCASCGFENRGQAAFCSSCGVRLVSVCSRCAGDLAPEARFCDRCGQPVTTPDAQPAGTRAPGPSTSSLGQGRSTIASGRYQLIRLLGEGAKKRVYLARDTRLEREVALALIKTEGLDEAGLARVRREARAMGKLGDHPHIVTVHDVGDELGQPYIVSQYMAGGDVARLLESSPQHRIEVALALRIADQICDALEYAHGRDIIHRDLKPGNIWLTGEAVAKLGDFGLAVALDRSRLSQAGTIVGTVAYLPPEQALGRPPEPRSDLYALGVVLYEAVTGRPPFLGDDAVTIISQHINTPPVAPSWHNPQVPRPLERVILRLLAKAPEDRPASARALRELLQAIACEPSAVDELGTTELANPLDRLAGGAFVGREREEKDLRSGFQDALSGRGRLLLLAGEPGIGKTRAAEELATYARLRNAQVLWGRCYEGEGAPAFWPWVQIIRSYVHERDPTALLSTMGVGAADIAQVVSEVRERLPGLPPPLALEPEQARFRLFNSVTTFLKNAATRQPLVLILDDLHWADKPSLLLLQFLAREMADARLLVVGTYRDVELRRQHPLSQTLADLAREQLSQRVHLAGLSEVDLARFIEITVGSKPPTALVTAVYKESEGNPFFVTEIVRLLATDGRLEHPEEVKSWSVIIPQGVREVIGKRLDHLSDDCNGVLTTAAVIGREFGLDVLVQVSDLSEDRLVELLEEAVAARVITEVTATNARYLFSHALIRETLYDELTLTRRVRLHRRIANVLEGLYAAKPEPHLAELAYHFFQAARVGDVDKAVTYAQQAGQRAVALLAYEEAARLYGLALQAIDLKDQPGQDQRCNLLLALGDARWRAGEVAAAKESLQQAASAARAAKLPEHFARAAIGFGSGIGPMVGVEFGVHDASVTELLEEALQVLDAGDSALRARVLACLAIALYWSSSEGRRGEVSQQALEIARRVGDKAALAQALHSRHFSLWGPGNLTERLEVATEILELAEAAGDQEAALRGHVYRLGDLLELGQLQAAEQERADYIRLAEQLRQPYYLWWAAVLRVTQPLFEGRCEEAELLAQTALAVGQQAQEPNALQVFGAQMLALRWTQGRLEEVEMYIQGFAEQYATVPAWRCALAFLYGELGREEQAREQFERVAANDFRDLPLDIGWLVAMTLIAQVCGMLRDAARARLLYDLLRPCSGRNIVHPAAVCIGSTDLPLGLLAATMSEWSLATEHFERALAMNTEMGTQPLRARTHLAYAAMLIERAAPADLGLARDHLNRALDSGQEIGMKALVERALALKLQSQGFASIDLQTSIDAVVSAINEQPPDLRRHAAPDGTVTILFSDIEGYSRMTERLGDQRAQELLRVHNAIIREQLRAQGGFEVKAQGDGFMLAFASARRALLCAAAIQRVFASREGTDGDESIRIRIGLHTGETIKEADDFFGKNVILAARIAAQARGGEILASHLVKQLAESAGDITFGEAREIELKGLSGLHRVHSVLWS
jgi:class 3 adenylate cyclase